MTNVDYKVLKSCIIKSCSPKFKHSLGFKIDFDKLVEEAGAMNLVPVYVGLSSRLITPEDIAFIGEYYEKYMSRQGSKVSIAAELGISRTTLDKLFRKYRKEHGLADNTPKII